MLASQALCIIMIWQRSVSGQYDSAISGHGVGSLVSQWSKPIKSSCVYTVARFRNHFSHSEPMCYIATLLKGSSHHSNRRGGATNRMANVGVANYLNLVTCHPAKRFTPSLKQQEGASYRMANFKVATSLSIIPSALPLMTNICLHETICPHTH